MVYMKVRVTDKSGSPVPNIKVAVGLVSFTGGVYPDEWTDRDGVAEFELDLSCSDKIRIYYKGTQTEPMYPKANVHVVI